MIKAKKRRINLFVEFIDWLTRVLNFAIFAWMPLSISVRFVTTNSNRDFWPNGTRSKSNVNWSSNWKTLKDWVDFVLCPWHCPTFLHVENRQSFLSYLHWLSKRSVVLHFGYNMEDTNHHWELHISWRWRWFQWYKVDHGREYHEKDEFRFDIDLYRYKLAEKKNKVKFSSWEVELGIVLRPNENE